MTRDDTPSVPRLPASYFVSIAYMCWANRRAVMDVSPAGDNVEVTYG